MSFSRSLSLKLKKSMKLQFTKKQIIFIILFVVLGLASFKIPIFNIIGSNQKFTFFDFLGPTTGLIIGSIPGALSVFFVKLVSVILNNQSFDLTTIIRFFPMMAAAIYFGTRSKKILVVPIICILLFIIHPIGRQVWYFSAFWFIPLVAFFKKDRLIFKSLGSTFTAHGIGSVAFLYAFNLKASIWIGLIPVVWMERLLFTGGIWLSYLVMNTVLDKVVKRLRIKYLSPLVNPKYVWSRNFFRLFS